MKIHRKHYQEIEDHLNALCERLGYDHVLAYRAQNLGKDKAKRFRWDLFWAAKCNEIDLYSYGYNDNHIDTALKTYIKRNEVLSRQ